ncbi:hypothetical protein B0T17DRAFT_617520 [Bombardia bombarda]|uniref:Uncharacterized protein n=1 Tax=Bombardia bombarda TaxID=252184 RepID=A0AA39X187_9PEZI|nr:hypothetical protein B0T17DRAFT_617520 [Bombardia bombarda]
MTKGNINMPLWHADDFNLSCCDRVRNITDNDNDCARALLCTHPILGPQPTRHETIRANLIILFQTLMFFADFLGPRMDRPGNNPTEMEFWDTVVREWRLLSPTAARLPRWIAMHAAAEYSQCRAAYKQKHREMEMYRDHRELLLAGLIDKWHHFVTKQRLAAPLPLDNIKKRVCQWRQLVGTYKAIEGVLFQDVLPLSGDWDLEKYIYDISRPR